MVRGVSCLLGVYHSIAAVVCVCVGIVGDTRSKKGGWGMGDCGERGYELTATFRVDYPARAARRAFAAALQGAVYEATGGVPAVTAFFVDADSDATEVTVGFRFAQVSPVHLDEWATDMFAHAVQRVQATMPVPTIRKLESTVVAAYPSTTVGS